jgi:Family of unknown function (DUF6152)
MTSIKAWLTSVALVSGLLALPAAAHHSFPAQYDADKPITLTGTVTSVEWMNPHMLFYVDVTDASTGEVVNWTLEMGSPNALLRLGWTRDSMQPGDVVTVEGSRARDGSPLVNARSVTLTKTGKKLFAGSSQNDER